MHFRFIYQSWKHLSQSDRSVLNCRMFLQIKMLLEVSRLWYLFRHKHKRQAMRLNIHELKKKK
jgi:hypothetical protein